MRRRKGAAWCVGAAAMALVAQAAAARAQAVVAPGDPGLLYSPYNWAVGAGAATTINAGAYLRTLFGGASVAATFDVAHDAAPLSEVECRVDGVGPWTVAAVAPSVPCPVPAQTASAPFHSLELVVKSTSERVNRWDAAAPGSAVVFTGLSLAAGARVKAPAAAPCDVLFYGDSVMEGVRVLDIAAPLDTDRNDAVAGWAWQAGKALGCEFGLVAFGGSGLTGPGSGGVPPLAASFGQVFAGRPRAFEPAPALIVVNDGANDANVAAPAFEAVFAATLRAILAATPVGSPVAVMRTFLGIQEAPTLAAVRAVGSPRVTYVDTAGFLDKALGMDDIGLHPTAANDQARVGPMSAAALRAVLFAGRAGGK